MDLKLKTWYLAEHIFGDVPYYNFFLEINNNVKFISIDAKTEEVQLIKVSYKEFETNILDSFEFEGGKVGKNIERKTIKGILR